MNIHPYHQPYPTTPSLYPYSKVHSPSYTTSAETLCSSQHRSHNQYSIKEKKKLLKTPKKEGQNSPKTPTTLSEASIIKDNPLVSIDNIKWQNVQGFFSSQMEIRVQYTVKQELKENITWRITYLGSALSENYDQILSQFETEENQRASSYPEKRQFKLTLQPPKWNLISFQELFNISALTISAFYKDQQFIKLGYYVHYQLPSLTREEKIVVSRHSDPKEALEKQDKRKKFSKSKKITKKNVKTPSPDHKCEVSTQQNMIMKGLLWRTVRTILADKPRVTKFPIDWQKQTKSMYQMNNETESQFSEISSNQHLITEYMKPKGKESFSCSIYS